MSQRVSIEQAIRGALGAHSLAALSCACTLTTQRARTQVFTQPPVATVGLTEHECSERYDGAFDVYISKFKTMRHTLAGRDERTLMKLIVHADSDTVVGVHVVGTDAPEMLQGVAIAMKAGAKKAHFDATLGIHPTAAEELVAMRHKARTVVGAGFKAVEGAAPAGAAKTPAGKAAAAAAGSAGAGTSA